MGGRVVAQKGTILNTGQKSIGTTSAIIVAANQGMMGLRIKNVSAGTVYLGNSNVNSSNGFPLQQNEEYRESWYAGPAIYGVTASGNSTVGFLYYTE